ncbi:unnamed protein product, partial [marine sediment metagenome]
MGTPHSLFQIQDNGDSWIWYYFCMNNLEKPRVSVIVAVYNGEKLLQKCIHSILTQSYSDFEVIVVNDGSSDGTKKILASFNSPQMHVLHFEKNRGVSAARNAGFLKARGEYISVLDSDDFCLPNRLKEQVDYLDRTKEVDLIGSYVTLRSELGDVEVATRPLRHISILKAASWSCPIWNTTIMFRRSILKTVSGYPEEYHHGEDYRFLVQVMKHFKVANLPKVHVIKRE